jgi:tRNA-specific 2-thiouridylase
MSGGVDSSVAAALLKRDGYDVVGCFMRLGSLGEDLDTPRPDDSGGLERSPTRIHKQGCCSIGDAADARLVAAELDIPFYVCNFRNDFARVIDYFVDEYAAGRTPNPCVRCNDWLKFGKLHDYARAIGATHVASGHHARIGTRGRSPALLRGVDTSKDQSYVLFGAPRDRLSEMLLPVGDYTKPEIRDLASSFGLPVFDKPDSQEICFVPDNDYAALVESRRPHLAREGDILDSRGNVLGRHDGHHRFTIGQRRHVGVALGHPVYVVDKDPIANTVTIGEREDLGVSACDATQSNWLVDPFTDWTPALAQVRYNARAVPAEARVDPSNPRAINVRFDEPHDAVAPGQAVVLYDHVDPDRVIAGAWITQTR